MRPLALIVLALTAFGSSATAQELQQSVKKQLFVFPTRYESTNRHMTTSRRVHFDAVLMRELVYNFPRFAFYEMPADANVDSFLANADEYLLAHAQEIVQKRVDTGGRYGEAPITLDDLVEIVENGYAFVPVVREARFDENSWSIQTHIDIHRTHDNLYVGRVNGSSDSFRAILGSFRGLHILRELGDDEDDRDKPSEREIEDQYRSLVDGIASELRTNVRAMDEFSIKAIVTTPGVNQIIINRGANLGVRLDERYKVWSASDLDAEGVTMLGFGKVRAVRENESDVQLLIGGWEVTYADQVVEDARFGLNITSSLGTLPIATDGFDPFRQGIANLPGDRNDDPANLPDNGAAPRFWLGVGVEYGLGPLLGISELYATAEGGLVGLEQTATFMGNAGLTKKYWFRRAALLVSARYGVMGVTFTDLEDETVNGDPVQSEIVHGLIAQTGCEVLLTPDWAVQGWAGYSFFPEQTVLAEDHDGGYRATVDASGFFFRGGLLFTL